ncbi:MAG: transposase [Hyphomicrobiales bacterium]|nr:transposase [Hyphomicrobiales bacterium]
MVRIKSEYESWYKQSFPFLKKVYWGTDGIWSDGYFVSTVGIDNAVIRKYIEHQGEEDSGQAELEL